MNREYYVLQPDGSPGDGPFAEEEILDLLDSGDLAPEEKCLHQPTGRVEAAGRLFQVIAPEPAPPADPVPWQPAPFPGEAAPAAPRPGKSGPRLLYRGNPCVLTYWRSVFMALLCFAYGVSLREKAPGMLALGLLTGSVILLVAILHRLGRHYQISTARVELVTGLILKNSRELRIADIRAINVEHTGLMGLLGIGTVTFSSPSGEDDDIVFSRVARAVSLKHLVRKLQDAES